MALTDKNFPEENIVDIQIGEPQRQRFRINSDSSKMIELNLSDLNITSRLESALTKITEVVQELQNTKDENVTTELAKADKAIREQIDYIFDYPVADVCEPTGTMLDPKNGELRYEQILYALLGLYEGNIKDEYVKMNKRIKQHTQKYTAPKSTGTRRKK